MQVGGADVNCASAHVFSVHSFAVPTSCRHSLLSFPKHKVQQYVAIPHKPPSPPHAFYFAILLIFLGALVLKEIAPILKAAVTKPPR
jgi:hypothetical protein